MQPLPSVSGKCVIKVFNIAISKSITALAGEQFVKLFFYNFVKQLRWGILSMGDFVQADFVLRGFYPTGDFVLIPIYMYVYIYIYIYK